MGYQYRLNPCSVRRRLRAAFVLVWACCVIASLLTSERASAQDGEGAVYVIEISRTIDLGLAPYLERVLDDAKDAGAAAVIIEINTPGGRLDAVLQMKDAILDSPVRTIAFVDRTAFSAGALVAIASNEIYMTSGAVLGAATPVDGGTGDTASEKVVSAVRSTFAATAEARGRDPLVAEAMVDINVDIPGLSPSGQLLTLTTTTALDWGYADGVAETREELLATTGLADARVIETSLSLAERATRVITDPVIAGLLLTVGLILIVADFFVDGLGIMAIVGVIAIATFLWGHLVAGLAGWEDVTLVVVGVALIAIEIFIIPGFGVAGILGLVLLFGGIFLAMIGRDIRSPDQVERSAFTVVAVLLLLVVGWAVLMLTVPRRTRFGGTVLQSTVDSSPSSGATQTSGWLRRFGGNASLDAEFSGPHAPVSQAQSLVGASGIAVTPLHPSGTAEIGGSRIDVVAEGDFIDEGDAIVVVLDEGYRRVVQRAAD
jgi:membrane-bound serine protease (ClpP class)